MICILTGVAGSGKTTLGKLLARRLGIRFFDADSFHTQASIEKMQSGKALDDADRWPWLERIHFFLHNQHQRGSFVLACSALKEVYRQKLSEGFKREEFAWIHLQGEPSLLKERLEGRLGHFMPSSLLESQLEAYEEPKEGLLLQVAEKEADLLEKMIAFIQFPGAEVGVVGLGVMGKNLARNLAGKGFRLAIYNRELAGHEEGVAVRTRDEFPELDASQAFDSLENFIYALAPPRKVLVMIEAGRAVDQVLEQMIANLSPGDTVVDGGNAHYLDTAARQQRMSEMGIYFVGAGISGGAEGALRGPSVMPGGSRKGYGMVEGMLKAMAARNARGEVCCAYLGDGGAGHFVKMVHNGIEYAEMQLLAEIYGYLRFAKGMEIEQMVQLFTDWSARGAGSYLLEITVEILQVKEPDGILLLDQIARRAGAKGSGGWAVSAACALGVAVPNLAAALFARFQSVNPGMEIRMGVEEQQDKNKSLITEDLFLLYRFARILNFFQGFSLIRAGRDSYGWQINFRDLFQIWSAGCILRSELLEEFAVTLGPDPNDLPGTGLLMDMMAGQWAKILSSGMKICAGSGTFPLLAGSLQYAKSLFVKENGANLIQAQRDFFGAHGFERVDAAPGVIFHVAWKRE